MTGSFVKFSRISITNKGDSKLKSQFLIPYTGNLLIDTEMLEDQICKDANISVEDSKFLMLGRGELIVVVAGPGTPDWLLLYDDDVVDDYCMMMITV